MKTKMKLKIVGAILVAIVGLSSCFGPVGGAEPPTLEDIEPYEVNEAAFNAFVDSATEQSSFAAYGMVSAAYLFANLPLLYVDIALDGWDESMSQTYTDESGTYTTTWDRVGDTWTWTVTFDDGSTTTTIDITVTAIETGWDVSVAFDDETVIEGLYEDDGSSGLVTFFATGTSERWVIEWGDSGLPGYDVGYSVIYYGADNEKDQELILDFTDDGSAGTWEYSDYTDPAQDATGSWTS